MLCVAGELVYLNIFGQGLLFVNSYEAAVDLLEKRGAIYSDKPKMIMAGELQVPPPPAQSSRCVRCKTSEGN